MRQLTPNTKDYAKMSEMFTDMLDGGALLKAGAIVRAFEVYNPALASNFAAQRSILAHRIENDPNVFRKSDWQNDRFEARTRVKKHFDRVVSMSNWNSEEKFSPIVPVVHGTTVKLGWKIIETGFASLASLDAGWYGAGMYFTTSALYASPYYMTSQNPAILICLVNTGNPYPVIENRTDTDTLWGLPIKSGYQSNYVLASKDGKVYEQGGDVGYNEIVIPQESQVMPVYLLELNYNQASPVAMQFSRVVSGKMINAKPSVGSLDAGINS
jgi:hypothetical protein